VTEGRVFGEHPTLNRSTDGDHFIGVDALVGILSSEGASRLHNLGHTGHAADEDKLVDLASADSGFLEARFGGTFGSLEKMVRHLFESGAGEGLLDVLGP